MINGKYLSDFQEIFLRIVKIAHEKPPLKIHLRKVDEKQNRIYILFLLKSIVHEIASRHKK